MAYQSKISSKEASTQPEQSRESARVARSVSNATEAEYIAKKLEESFASRLNELREELTKDFDTKFSEITQKLVRVVQKPTAARDDTVIETYQFLDFMVDSARIPLRVSRRGTSEEEIAAKESELEEVARELRFSLGAL